MGGPAFGMPGGAGGNGGEGGNPGPGGLVNITNASQLIHITITLNQAGISGVGGVGGNGGFGIPNGPNGLNGLDGKAASGGGIAHVGGNVSVGHLILSSNQVSAGGSGPDCAGTLTSLGYNLILDTTGCIIAGSLVGNITGLDPMLRPLQNNGGFTDTHGLLTGSPAIDNGDLTFIPPPATDQRDAPRIFNAIIDIGAFEYTLVDISSTKAGLPLVVNMSNSLVYLITVTNVGGITARSVEVTDVLPAEVNFVSSVPPPSIQNGRTNIFQLGDMIAGESLVITVNVSVVLLTIGQITNTAVVLHGDVDATPADNIAIALNSVPDTDADGDPDFTDPDDDNDGAPDSDEVTADTDQFDSASVLKILNIFTNGPAFDVEWKGGVLATQYLERSVSLLPPAVQWDVIFTKPPPTPITNITLDVGASTNMRAYYRIRAD